MQRPVNLRNKQTTVEDQDPEVVDSEIQFIDKEEEEKKQKNAIKITKSQQKVKDKEKDKDRTLQIYEDENFDLDYFKYLKDNKIDFEVKKKILDQRMPRKSFLQESDQKITNYHEKYTLSDICCRKKTGYNCCGRTSKESVFNKFGIGITLYFKFLKNLACYFFLFTILTIPQIYITYKISLQGNDRYKQDLNQFLYDTSIGPVGLSTLQCSLSETLFVDKSYTQTETLASLKCSAGYLEMSETYTAQFFDSKNESKNCGNIYETQEKSDINFNQCGDFTWGQILKQILLDKDCMGKEKCSISNDDFQDYFTDCWNDLQEHSDLQFRISSQCSDAEFELFDEFGKGQKISIEKIANFIAIMDVAIIILFIQMIMALGLSDNKTQNNIFRDRVQVSKFSIMVSNLPKLQENELKCKLKQHLDTRIQKYVNKKKKDKYPVKIIDIRIAETFEEIQLRQKEGITEQQKQLKIVKFIKKYDQNLKVIEQLIPGKVRIQDLKEAVPKFSKKQQKRAEKDLLEIEKYKKKVFDYSDKVKQNEENAYQVKFAYITFETMQATGLALKALKGGACQQLAAFLCSCCIGQQNRFYKKVLKIQQAPVPDNIQWENIYISSIVKYIRRFISIILTLVFLVGSFYAIIYVRNKTDEIKEQYPEVNCNETKYESISDEDIINESEQNSGAGYIQCFCSDKITDIIKYTTNKSGYFEENKEIYGVCYDWFQDYAFIQVLPLIAAVCVIEVNFLIQILFRKLSSFEKYNYLTQEYAARIYKIFFAMFVNTGLLLLIINIDFKMSSDNFLHSVLGGQYQDFTPAWFKNVGTVIIFTIAVNTISTPLVLLLFQLIRVTLRFFDRGCTGNGKKTKKSTIGELVDLYTGPEFMIDLRYSQILNVVFIGFIYSAGLPLLYFCVFFHLFLLYWFDKIWVLKICKIPKNYDEEMHNMVKKIIWIAPLLHLIFSIVIYGNFQIFYESQTYFDDLSTFTDSEYVKIFIERAVSRKYNIYLSVLLLVILAIIALRIFVWTPIKHLFKKCCKTAYDKQNIKNPRRGQSYYNFLNSEMVDQDNRLSDYYINENFKDIQFQKLMNQRQKELEEFLPIVSHQKHRDDYPIFLGLFSYDIRHNPIYKKLFNWESKINNLNTTRREKTEQKKQCSEK